MSYVDEKYGKFYPGTDTEFQAFIDTFRNTITDKGKEILFDYCFLQNAFDDRYKGTSTRDILNYKLCHEKMTEYKLHNYSDIVKKYCLITDKNILDKKRPEICECLNYLENDHMNYSLKFYNTSQEIPVPSAVCTNAICKKANDWNPYIESSQNCPDIQVCIMNIENSTLTSENMMFYCSSKEGEKCPLDTEEECTAFCKQLQYSAESGDNVEVLSWCEPYLADKPPEFCEIPENQNLWQCDKDIPKNCQIQSPPQSCYNTANRPCEGPEPPISCNPEQSNDFCDLIGNSELWQCKTVLPEYCKVSQPSQECFDIAGKSCQGPLPPKSCYDIPEDTTNFLIIFIFIILIIVIIIMIVLISKRVKKNR